MGTIISNFFISLDGVVESPDQWHFPYWNDEMERAVGKGLETTEVLLMGRVLYDEWASYWPTSDDEPIASMFNDMPKYVVSSTLQQADWNNTTIVNGDVAAAPPRAEGDGRGRHHDFGQRHAGPLAARQRAARPLNLLVHPIVVGTGQRLFEDTPTHPLQLVSQDTFSTGVINLAYAARRLLTNASDILVDA